MIAAIDRRLPLRDAVCDRAAIYMDAQPIALRPEGLADFDWNRVCIFMCGARPMVDKLEFKPAPPNDPEAWARMETYMNLTRECQLAATAAEPSFRKKGKRK